MQPGGLKQDRNTASLNDEVHLLPVESDDVAGLIFDIGSRDEWYIFAQSLNCPSQYLAFFSVAQIVDIARIHIDRVYESGSTSRNQVLLERLHSYVSVRLVGQQGCGDSLYFSAKLSLFD